MPLEADLQIKYYEAAEIIQEFENAEIAYDVKGTGGGSEKLSGDDAANYLVAIWQNSYNDGDPHKIPNRVEKPNRTRLSIECQGNHSKTELKISTGSLKLEGGSNIDFRVIAYRDKDIGILLRELMQSDSWNTI